MKTKVWIGMLALAMALMPFAGFAADEPVTATLKGEAVDMHCYVAGRSGEAHAACATSCAEKGNPIGFVVKEGDKSELYLVIGAGGKQAKDVLAAHMGKQISVTGKVTTKDGMKIIAVEEVAAS
jgi:predicted lipoprotein with Yx(FWY)xxD motif